MKVLFINLKKNILPIIFLLFTICSFSKTNPHTKQEDVWGQNYNLLKSVNTFMIHINQLQMHIQGYRNEHVD